MANMNTEELILNFSSQMKDYAKQTQTQNLNYEQKLNTAKERYLKLQGAVEGLNILQDQSAPAPTEETVSEEPVERELLNEN